MEVTSRRELKSIMEYHEDPKPNFNRNSMRNSIRREVYRLTSTIVPSDIKRNLIISGVIMLLLVTIPLIYVYSTSQKIEARKIEETTKETKNSHHVSIKVEFPKKNTGT